MRGRKKLLLMEALGDVVGGQFGKTLQAPTGEDFRKFKMGEGS